MGAKKEFPCIGCGLCCKVVGNHFENYDIYPKYLQKVLDDFPHEIDEQGVCSQLKDDGKCKVYKNRPLACNMHNLYSYGKKEIKKSRVEFYEQLNSGCVNLMMKYDRADLVPDLLEANKKLTN